MKNRKRKLLFVIIVMLLMFAVNNRWFAVGKDSDLITEDVRISSYMSLDGNAEYGFSVGDKLIQINAAEYNLPLNFMSYNEDIRLRITY